MSTRRVAILAFPDMEVLDHAGPYEVFHVAGELAAGVGAPGFEVVSVGLRPGPVAGRGGFTVVPDHTIETLPGTDLLVVPGGAGTRPLLGDEALAAFLRERAATCEALLSVCTGALLLASAGLLAGRPALTHHTALTELAALEPTAEVVTGRRFVRTDETVWCSGGISAGIDLSLHVVETLAGRPLRDAVVEEMEWGWCQGRGSAD
ncbi:DJ-1/PfpI family protein [Nocardioides bruguierae]|uniref:DJ-1/PfpI family protein n=1 Tax=Nocardioides bruguierae TaxID=2945102 RepID=A0A9X2D502_9ACTN|nr:DJ-1/PfpI family protein [Nocardioides bruguierae]MCM0619323.1 DJ-1/PfpI family protein [Nocardioides bruguierae]